MGNSDNQFQDYLKEVFKILRVLNAKVTDVHRISPKFLKIAANVLKNHLIILFNYPINQGIFPDKLKAGLIHPIHKRDSKQSSQTTNPLPFYPCLEVFEKLMYSCKVNKFTL